MKYCTACGTEHSDSYRFCTGCGEAFSAMGAVTSTAPSHSATTSPPPRTGPRQLRCVACGSEIDMGLTCAACSRGSVETHLSVPKAAAPAANVNAHAKPSTAVGSHIPSPPATPAPNATKKKAGSAPSGRVVGALAGMAMALAAGVGHWANRHPGDASRSFAQLSPFGRGLDGTYDCVGPSATASLVISGSSANLVIPGMAQVKGAAVDRHGNTLSLKGGVAYDGNGYLLDASNDPYSTLATLGDDGQSITLHVEGQGDLRFLKR